MVFGVEVEGSLARFGDLLHELQFRDKIKSAQYHYCLGFEFDGFFEEFLVQGLFNKINELSKEFEFSTFKLGVSWPISLGEAERMHLKHTVQTPLIEKISKELNKIVNFSSADLEFLIDFNKKQVLVRVHSAYVSGRYCKYSREIAQTEYFCNMCRGKGCWYCNETGHFCAESVEELLAKVIVPPFGAKLLILHGAGREDMDVLMLGKGRPFIAEFLMPKKRGADLALIEKEINEKFKGKISVNSLKMSSLDEVSQVKDTHHDKTYAALVHANNEVDYSKIPVNQKIIVAQNTPTRVAARRADLERTKEVTILRVGEINSQEFVLIMRTSHGTYVKEFISGDNNRTAPSISSLVGTHCECMLLDVTDVCE